MRLFLDAHISGPRIARALRDAGSDVRAADEERELDGLTDEERGALRRSPVRAAAFMEADKTRAWIC